MKRLLLAAALCVASPAVNAQTALEFAAAGMGQPTAKPVRSYGRSRSVEPRGSVQNMIAAHVSSRIGSQWIGTALRIAKIESGYRCNARNGRAVGIFQNTNPAMFGVSRAAALTCDGGIRAGVAHMAMCIRMGATSPRQMYICHNAGHPFARRVERSYKFALNGH